MPHPPIIQLLKNNKFVVSVQVDPPHYSALENFIASMRALKDAGVQTVDVNSSRRISHDSLHLSVALQQEFGFEAIPHITTRDSSVNGLINEIYAAYEWGGIRTVLIITGDPYEATQAIIPTRGVYHTDAIGAIRAMNDNLKKEVRLGLDITMAAAVNQNDPLDHECSRLRKKQEVGTDFFMSQPVFNEAQADALNAWYFQCTDKPLLVGIWPLMHEKTITAIREGKIVGVTIPDEVYREAQHHIQTGTLGEWGTRNAQKLITHIRTRTRANGVYIVAPARNPLIILDIIKETLQT